MATLKCVGLTKSYGGRTVVKDVDIEVSSGEIVGLLGPNGAGKTTTFGMVVGLTAPDKGRVLLDDHDVTRDAMYVRSRKGIGYLPQEASIFRGLTVEQNIRGVLEVVEPVRDKRERILEELLAEFSVLLDEPFAGIDPIAVSDIQQIVVHLKTRGIGVLVTDHNVRETLKITDRAYIVHDGAIFRSGTPQALAADDDVKRIYLGTDFRLD